ncbi:MAG: hypothetical protein Ct9H300mP15_27270 [Gemmatimonadota bacterium]|nr:MAG: hypothetical protein Ct9H300mP15_27270 [Gemmatimonadota bacterium]
METLFVLGRHLSASARKVAYFIETMNRQGTPILFCRVFRVLWLGLKPSIRELFEQVPNL